MNVARLLDFKESREAPVLVLVDLHVGILTESEAASDGFMRVIENCRTVLAHARGARIPVAFVRQFVPAQSMLESRPDPTWIHGFEPRRSDMVFDRSMPSCYANHEFARMIERNGHSMVLAGLSAEMACLSTAVDAYHRRHQITYLLDACQCGPRPFLSAQKPCAEIAGIISQFGAITDTRTWIGNSSKLVSAVT